MTFQDIEAATMRLTLQAEALAALGAHLEVGGRGEAAHPALAPRFARVVELLGIDVTGLSEPEMRRLAGTIRAFFLQAAEMLRAPERGPGWRYDDPSVLEATGASSEAFPVIVNGVAPRLEGLVERLALSPRMLDVGTGVGRLAIAACRAWPSMRVVGLEPWAPSMTLARKNVADAGLTDRIELLPTRIEELALEGAFDLAWLPGPYLPLPVLGAAAEHARRALKTGGWVILGVFGSVPDPLALAVTELRVVRSGGEPLLGTDGVRILEAAGFRDVRAFPRSSANPMDLVVGRA